MKKDVERTQDQTTLGLFKTGARMDVEIPAWLTDEVAHFLPIESASDNTSEADEDEENDSSSLFNKGYVFSWGFLTESRSEDFEDDFDDLTEEDCSVEFEFCVQDLLIAFPNSAMLEDLVSWMYVNHPLASSKFETDECMGDWTMLMFTACGTKEIARLRRWLAQVFISKVLPDLLREGMKIVEAAKTEAIGNGQHYTVNEVFVERQRFQLCGDPKDLSF